MGGIGSKLLYLVAAFWTSEMVKVKTEEVIHYAIVLSVSITELSVNFIIDWDNKKFTQ